MFTDMKKNQKGKKKKKKKEEEEEPTAEEEEELQKRRVSFPARTQDLQLQKNHLHDGAVTPLSLSPSLRLRWLC